MYLQTALSLVANKLTNVVQNPLYEARLMLQSILKLTLTELLQKELTLLLNKNQTDKLQQFIKRRLLGEPLAYIVEYKDFYNSRFYVNKDVLIPRADTETIISATLGQLKDKDKKYNFIEIGVGSGNIILTLLQEYKNATAVATDVSAKALSVAKINAINLGLENRVTFIESDIFQNIAKNNSFDALFSNPPYIAIDDADVELSVVNFEPHLALFTQNNGLFFYNEILKNAINILKKHGKIFLEVGHKQANDVVQIAKNNGWINAKIIQDLSKLDRVIIL